MFSTIAMGKLSNTRRLTSSGTKPEYCLEGRGFGDQPGSVPMASFATAPLAEGADEESRRTRVTKLVGPMAASGVRKGD